MKIIVYLRINLITKHTYKWLNLYTDLYYYGGNSL